LLLINRLGDGLDGAVARQNGATDLGAYLDIVADFLLWSILPLGFLLYDGANAVAAAVLLSSFAMSMVVFLAFAILAEKRGVSTDAQGKKSFFYMAGLAEGTETISFFVIVMIWPTIFIPAAYGFALLVYLSVIGRVIVSVKSLQETVDE
jgi:phosphatidylglycerophosphate synthase